MNMISASISVKKSPGFWLACGWLALLTLLSLGASWLPLEPPNGMNWERMLESPILFSFDGSSQSWLGTDGTGRDILSRLIFGARISLAVGATSALVGLLLGGSLGVLAAYFRGGWGAAMVGSMDVILAFPGLVLLLGVSFHFGAGLTTLIPTLGILISPAFFRVARSATLKVIDREFVTSARLMGQGNLSILAGEILPNIAGPLMVYSVLMVAVLIVLEGAMSFLGLSVPPPQSSWGSMIAEGREVLSQAPHLCLIPVGALFFTVLSLNVVGEGLRKKFAYNAGGS